MKTLCLYYTRTGHTRKIMERVAELTDADLVEYTDGIDRSGIKGYLKSCLDSFWLPPKTSIVGKEPNWSKYDRVIVGMPVWAEKPCVVGRGFLRQFSGNFNGQVYLVVTHQAKNQYDKAIEGAYKYCANVPEGYFSIQTGHDSEMEIQRFVHRIGR